MKGAPQRPNIRILGAAPPKEERAPVDGGRSGAQWRLAGEAPAAFIYSQRNYAVMLATPADLADFAVGFSLTERIVDAPDDILAVNIDCKRQGVDLHIRLDKQRIERFDIRQQRRNLVGRAGCGLCGLENAETFFEALPRVRAQALSIPPAALAKALEAFPHHQPLNKRTLSVHGAAWVDMEGGIVKVREDIGRHNALDKLIGALALEGADLGGGFVLISSRCSYELVEKAARMGIPALASLSGPTAFAVRKAREANMALYCRSGNGFVRL